MLEDIDIRDSQGEKIELPPTAYRAARRGAVSAEPFDPTEAANETIVIPKDKDAQARIAAAISNNLLFSNLESDQRREVVDAMSERKVANGETVIKQGEAGDEFYVVDEGSFDVLVEGKGKVLTVGAGGSFGELALLYSQPRAATVVATTASKLWVVDGKTFRRIIMTSSHKKRKLYESFLKTVPILSSLQPAELVKLADALEPQQFEEDDNIITEGERGDTFYIIVEGEAVVYKTVDDQQEEMLRLKKGDYFGELALLNDKARAATVKPIGGPVRCAVLDRGAFIRILGPIIDILKRNTENYKKYTLGQI